MADPQLVSDEARKAVIEAYKRGDKIRDIEERHGIARATVYWILEQGGVTPNRLQRGRRLVGDDQQLAQLYLLIEAQETRINELEEAGRMCLETLAVRLRDIEAGVTSSTRSTKYWREIRQALDAFSTRLGA